MWQPPRRHCVECPPAILTLASAAPTTKARDSKQVLERFPQAFGSYGHGEVGRQIANCAAVELPMSADFEIARDTARVWAVFVTIPTKTTCTLPGG